jgi:hypothetical protein
VLRDRFGPEYDRTVENREDRRSAEAELLARQRQRAQFDVQPLPEATRLSFAEEWRELQERFVDQPAQAAGAADTLITRVMEARGYPMNDFDTQADLISVDHPDTVENYRFAHAVQQRAKTQQASTEDLRDALLRYRSLFDELLRPEGDGTADAVDGRTQTADYDDRARVNGGPGAQVPVDYPEAGEVGSTGPVASDTEYDNQRIGRGDGYERR